jgi:hypothetical protein
MSNRRRVHGVVVVVLLPVVRLPSTTLSTAGSNRDTLN